MTTQAFELQAVSDEELMAAAGGHGSPFTHKDRDVDLQHLAQQRNAHGDRHGLQSLGSHNVATMG